MKRFLLARVQVQSGLSNTQVCDRDVCRYGVTYVCCSATSERQNIQRCARWLITIPKKHQLDSDVVKQCYMITRLKVHLIKVASCETTSTKDTAKTHNILANSRPLREAECHFRKYPVGNRWGFALSSFVTILSNGERVH